MTKTDGKRATDKQADMLSARPGDGRRRRAGADGAFALSRTYRRLAET
jgi:hypothetical protein